MKATELRIGNYYNWRGGDAPDEGYDEIFSGKDFADICKHPNWFRPIPLTEEWLLRFGFKRTDVFQAVRFELSEYFVVTIHDSGNINFCLRNNSFSVSLKYVHQLQNLYFALTGEELKI